MKFLLIALSIGLGLGMVSCANQETERKVVGPESDTSSIPWNMAIAGQGQGQFGVMQQNQQRR